MRALRDGDVLLSNSLSVRSSVCRLWNLLSHSLRGSTWRWAEAFRIESDILVYCLTVRLFFLYSEGYTRCSLKLVSYLVPASRWSTCIVLERSHCNRHATHRAAAYTSVGNPPTGRVASPPHLGHFPGKIWKLALIRRPGPNRSTTRGTDPNRPGNRVFYTDTIPYSRDPNRATSINFIHVNGRSFYMVDLRVVVVEEENVLCKEGKLSRGNSRGTCLWGNKHLYLPIPQVHGSKKLKIQTNNLNKHNVQ